MDILTYICYTNSGMLSFEWDDKKDQENQSKHGVSFKTAQYVFLGPDTGERGKLFMKKKTKYTDEPLGKLRVVKDFLPFPEELAFKEEGIKVTMTLSKSSVDFFKRAAEKYHAPYQQMIRKLIDAYAVGHPML